MRIALDGNLLFEREKTGVGQMTARLIDESIKDRENEYQINIFDFCFLKRSGKLVKNLRQQGFTVKRCWWMSQLILEKLSNILPLKYFWFFGRKADVTVFFSYFVPRWVGTKTAAFIYDMVIKAHPETMSETGKRRLEPLGDFISRTDRIFTISDFSKNEIVKYYGLPASRIGIIPCGVDLDKFCPDTDGDGRLSDKYGLTPGYILYLGTLEPRKNLMTLINAYKILTERKDNAPDLVIAGKKGWMYENILEKVVVDGLEDRVKFVGYIPDEDVPPMMRGAKMFVFPSRYEGFGMPVAEAMACGIPVIISDIEALQEVAGDVGITVPAMDAEGFADAMAGLLSDEDRCLECSRNGLERAKQFAWNRVSGEFVNELMKV